MGGNDHVEALVEEFRAVARCDWRKSAGFDFEKLPELTAILASRTGATDERVPALKALLGEMIEFVTKYEQTHPPVLDRSVAFAGEALLKLHDEWNDHTLTERREGIRLHWKKVVPGEGPQPLKSVAGFIKQFEIDVYRQLGEHLLDMTDCHRDTPPPRLNESDSPPADAISEWPVERQPAAGQGVVILIAAPTMRDGPTSALVRLVREFAPYWRASQTMVYAVDGSYKEIWRSGLLQDYDDFVCLRAGFEGGLVYATEIVVAAKQIYPAPDVQVIYLIDPRDNTALYPETAEIKRECILTRTPLLTTYKGAVRWLGLEWSRHVDNGRSDGQTSLLVDRTEGQAEKALASRTMPLALAANDRHKSAMSSFAVMFADLLTRYYPDRYATYTTGAMLNGGTSPSDDADRTVPELGTVGWAKLLTRGREGGVVQLARKVLDDECGTILFFQDAEREHDHEVRVLDRAAQLPGTDCLVLYDADSATRWAGNVSHSIERNGDVGPITLVEAYRRVFGVELVLADSSPAERPRAGRTKPEAMDVWDRVAEAGATYVLGAISAAVRRRRQTRQPARIGLPWGGAIQDVVGQLEGVARPSGLAAALGVQEFVAERAGPELNARRGTADTWPPTPRMLGALEPDELRVVPTVGLVGSRNRSLEAHSSVERVVHFVGGHAVAYPEYAYLLKDENGTSPESASLREEWSQLDVLLLGAAPVRGDSDKRVVGLPADLVDAMKDAYAIGTIYLRDDGSEIVEASNPGFWQTGIPMEQVRQLASSDHSDVVLVAGEQDVRVEPAWAALKARLVSTFVTDPDFAWKVLQLEVPGISPR